MNATLGHWLFSNLAVRQSRALRKPRQGESGYQPIMGTFNPDAGGVPDLVTNSAAFQARYSLPFSDLAGSEIGESRVPDRTILQDCVRRSENPCSLNNNTSYVVTELDIFDLRYTAKNGRPAWEAIESLGLLCLRETVGNGGNGQSDQQLQAARAEIASLKAELSQKNAKIGQLETEVNRLRGLVAVAVPPDIDETVALLTGAGANLAIGPGIKARFKRLGKFVADLKKRKP